MIQAALRALKCQSGSKIVQCGLTNEIEIGQERGLGLVQSFPELRAKRKQETRMTFWKQNVDQIITSNGFPLLSNAGSISHQQMEARTAELYQQFDQQRRQQEALQADQQDEADLQALESKLKRRPQP
jgi:hypothetical protein